MGKIAGPLLQQLAPLAIDALSKLPQLGGLLKLGLGLLGGQQQEDMGWLSGALKGARKLVQLENLQEKLLNLTSENMPSKQVVDWLSMLLTLLSEENLVLTNS